MNPLSNFKLRLSVLPMIAAACILAGCESSKSPAQSTVAGTSTAPSGRYRIVTTTAMVTDIVQRVTGVRAEVIGLMGTGVDPHLYKPTAGDIAKLGEADVVFYSGLMLEGRMDATLKRLRDRGKPAWAVTEGIDPKKILHAEQFAGHPDPHVWGDVSAWSACTEYVAKLLAEFDPPHADEYRRNAESYRAELAELDVYVRQVVASIPESQRYLVTAHDAFEYFSKAYGIPVRSVLGITTESEAGVDDINQLVDFLVEHKVPSVFVETSVNSRNIEAVIEGAARRGWTVRVGGNLFSDAMGAPGTYEGTYIGMLDHNATVIARALGGKAPEGGFQEWQQRRKSGINASHKPSVEVLGIYSFNNKQEILEKEIQDYFSTRPPEGREQRREYVRELLESLVLIEVIVRNRDGRFDAGDFTQDVPSDTSSQVAYGEEYLTLEGNSVIETPPTQPPEGQTLRLAFYLHDWDANKPLATSYGIVECPPPEPMPERFAKLVPYWVP